MRMKKLLFLCCLVLCASLTSCKWLEIPANAEYIGTGYIQNDRGIYYVEINSIRYSPERIYTNSSNRHGKNMMDPVEGMKVTCFHLHGNPEVTFIVGEHSEEYLEEYFTTNETSTVIFAVILFLPIIGILCTKTHLEMRVVHKD